MNLQDLMNQVRENADRLYNERINKKENKEDKKEIKKERSKKKNG